MNNKKIHHYTKDEIHLLRFSSFNLTENEISIYMNLNLTQISRLKSAIKYTLNEDTWLHILRKSFQKSLLQISDYLLLTEKRQAMIYVLKIENHLKNSFSKKHKKKFTLQLEEFIKSYILDIQYSYQKEFLLETGNNNFALNEKEMQYLRWILLGKTNVEISTIMQVSNQMLGRYKKSIFNKLQVANWFNAVRVAARLSIVTPIYDNTRENPTPKPQEHSHIHFVKKILVSHGKIKDYSEKEYKTRIYNDLLRYYNTLEFTHFLQIELPDN